MRLYIVREIVAGLDERERYPIRRENRDTHETPLAGTDHVTTPYRPREHTVDPHEQRCVFESWSDYESAPGTSGVSSLRFTVTFFV